MAKCKHETENGRCGLKESYAYQKECHTEEFCRCHEPIELCVRNEPMTNADRIRAMSDRELAEFLCDSSDCYFGKCGAYGLCQVGHGKANGLLKWLKQPAEVDNG